MIKTKHAVHTALVGIASMANATIIHAAKMPRKHMHIEMCKTESLSNQITPKITFHEKSSQTCKRDNSVQSNQLAPMHDCLWHGENLPTAQVNHLTKNWAPEPAEAEEGRCTAEASAEGPFAI